VQHEKEPQLPEHAGDRQFQHCSRHSRQIVGDEPSAKKPPTSTLEAPPITTYTGPTVGINSMARAPTVGYYWSLEPQTDTH